MIIDKIKTIILEFQILNNSELNSLIETISSYEPVFESETETLKINLNLTNFLKPEIVWKLLNQNQKHANINLDFQLHVEPNFNLNDLQAFVGYFFSVIQPIQNFNLAVNEPNNWVVDANCVCLNFTNEIYWNLFETNKQNLLFFLNKAGFKNIKLTANLVTNPIYNDEIKQQLKQNNPKFKPKTPNITLDQIKKNKPDHKKVNIDQFLESNAIKKPLSKTLNEIQSDDKNVVIQGKIFEIMKKLFVIIN